MKQFAAIAFTLAVLVPAGAAAQTHMGVASADQVMLISGGALDPEPCSLSFKGRALFQLHPDGKKDTEPFVVPEGRVLVVTEVEWGAFVDSSLAGYTLNLSISLTSPENWYHTLFKSSSVTVPYKGSIDLGTSDQLTDGFLVKDVSKMCLSTSATDGSGFVVVEISEIVLRGYLMDEGK